MAGSVQNVYKEPTVWDGSLVDMTWAGYVVVWCFTAPTTPYSIKCGSQTAQIPQLSDLNDGSTVSNTNQISGVGRYTVPGNCWITLLGGEGGTFNISGGN